MQTHHRKKNIDFWTEFSSKLASKRDPQIDQKTVKNRKERLRHRLKHALWQRSLILYLLGSIFDLTWSLLDRTWAQLGPLLGPTWVLLASVWANFWALRHILHSTWHLSGYILQSPAKSKHLLSVTLSQYSSRGRRYRVASSIILLLYNKYYYDHD